MRKIFIDCGANDGCSVELFRKSFPDHAEFEVYCFEANKKFRDSLLNYTQNVYTALVWIDENGASFGGWKMKEFGGGDGTYVNTIDLSTWIRESFLSTDYIILKLDIEGAEYKVIEKMYHDGTLTYIDEIYGELHGPKTGHTREDDQKLIQQLEDHKLRMYLWDALETSFVSGEYYSMKFMEEKMYPVWESRGMKIT